MIENGYYEIKVDKGQWLFITDTNEVFASGDNTFMMCALFDGQPMGSFGRIMAFRIGTLVKIEDAYCIVADNNDYLPYMSHERMTRIDGKNAIRLDESFASAIRGDLLS